MVSESKIKAGFREARKKGGSNITLEKEKDETLDCEIVRLESNMVRAELLCFEDGDTVLEVSWEEDVGWEDEKLTVPGEVDTFEVYQETSDNIRMVINFNDYGF